MQKILLSSIKIYQRYLSPFLTAHCHYIPTCSQYAIEAIAEHGIWRGLQLTLIRLGRCHPFCRGGYDLVPKKTTQCIVKKR